MWITNRIGWITAGLVAAWLGWQALGAPVYGQPEAAAVHRGGDLIAIRCPGDQTGERVMIVDPRERSMAVYDIGRDGVIQLKSVRNVQADLRITSFNSSGPTPEEIQLSLERR